MNEDRRRILGMLADGVITADEAERLIAALGEASDGPEAPAAPPKYLRVKIDAADGRAGRHNVDVKVPMQLLRAGVKLGALMPAGAREQLDAELRRKGVPFSLDQLKPDKLLEALSQLSDLTVDVDDDKARVRIFCE